MTYRSKQQVANQIIGMRLVDANLTATRHHFMIVVENEDGFDKPITSANSKHIIVHLRKGKVVEARG